RRRKGVLEGFVERLLLAPTLIAIAIVLIRFAFRIRNHFGFSDGADKDLQGYDANFGALIDERSPFRLIRFPPTSAQPRSRHAQESPRVPPVHCLSAHTLRSRDRAL